MRIHFFGATRTTTGSMYLLEINGKRLLLECGLFQGRREESIQRNCRFPFDPKQMDAVVLSHAHIDHAGNLPNLSNKVTPATSTARSPRATCAASCSWIPRISRWTTPHSSPKNARNKHLPPVEPLYTIADAEKTLKQFVAFSYDRPFPVWMA